MLKPDWGVLRPDWGGLFHAPVRADPICRGSVRGVFLEKRAKAGLGRAKAGLGRTFSRSSPRGQGSQVSVRFVRLASSSTSVRQ